MGANENWRLAAPFLDWGSTTTWAAPRCTREKCLGYRRDAKSQHPARHLQPAVPARENSHPTPDWLAGSPGLDPAKAAVAIERTLLDVNPGFSAATRYNPTSSGRSAAW